MQSARPVRFLQICHGWPWTPCDRTLRGSTCLTKGYEPAKAFLGGARSLSGFAALRPAVVEVIEQLDERPAPSHAGPHSYGLHGCRYDRTCNAALTEKMRFSVPDSVQQHTSRLNLRNRRCLFLRFAGLGKPLDCKRTAIDFERGDRILQLSGLAVQTAGSRAISSTSAAFCCVAWSICVTASPTCPTPALQAIVWFSCSAQTTARPCLHSRTQHAYRQTQDTAAVGKLGTGAARAYEPTVWLGSSPKRSR